MKRVKLRKTKVRPAPKKRGRPPFAPTKQQCDEVIAHVNNDVSEVDIAAALGISRTTLRLHFKRELRHGKVIRLAENYKAINRAAQAGNGAAMRLLDKIMMRAERKEAKEAQARKRKRALAASAKQQPPARAENPEEGNSWDALLNTVVPGEWTN